MINLLIAQPHRLAAAELRRRRIPAEIVSSQGGETRALTTGRYIPAVLDWFLTPTGSLLSFHGE